MYSSPIKRYVLHIYAIGTNTYSVSFRKTVEYGEDELGISVRIVGEEDAHGVHQHLVQAGREHRLRQLTQVFLQQA
jgi:hypothetical protein